MWINLVVWEFCTKPDDKYITIIRRSYEGDGESETESLTVCAFLIEGEGWKIYPDDASSLEFWKIAEVSNMNGKIIWYKPIPPDPAMLLVLEPDGNVRLMKLDGNDIHEYFPACNSWNQKQGSSLKGGDLFVYINCFVKIFCEGWCVFPWQSLLDNI